MSVRPLTALLAFAVVLAGPVSAQIVLQQNDIAVATTNGVFLLHLRMVAVRVLTGPLVEPAIEWEPDSDRFYVASGNQLLRVTVQAFASGGATVQTIATLPPGSRLTDVDIDHSTGDVWFFDRDSEQALRFAVPVVQGAAPDLSMQLAQGARSLSIDSVNHPLSLVYMTSSGLMQQTVDGRPVNDLPYPLGSNEAATDVSWQDARSGTFLADTNSHGIYLLPFDGAQAAIILQPPTAPFIRTPTDVEWLPNSSKLYAVTTVGVAAGAFPSLQTSGTGVHVVVIRPGGGQVGGIPIARLVSAPNGLTGLSGTGADISILMDGGFAGPYGNSSPALSGELPVLETVSKPDLGNTAFAMRILNGPPGRPTYAGIGLAPTQLTIGGGVQLINLRLWMPVGQTNPVGGQFIPAAVPNNPALIAMDLYIQGVVFGTSLEPAFTNAMRVRFR